MELILKGNLRQAWAGKNVFAHVQQLEGEIFREKEGRRTLRFVCDGDYYFCKLHTGIGWAEIIKNLCQGKRPVLGALDEWRAINRVKALGLETLDAVAFGKKGLNPATQISFLVTRELGNTISLEEYAANWRENSPSLKSKRALIAAVAAIVRAIHQAGINHRDLYICHFLLDKSPEFTAGKSSPKLFLVDLHRAQVRTRVPARWVIKDLASIYFSSLDIGLTRRDALYFLQEYFDDSLRNILRDNRGLLDKVSRRATRLYLRDFGRIPKLP